MGVSSVPSSTPRCSARVRYTSPCSVRVSVPITKSARRPAWWRSLASGTALPLAVSVASRRCVLPYTRRWPVAPSATPCRSDRPRSWVPASATTRVPCVSALDRVRMLITPFTALAPHSVAPGPLMTSMRSTSSSSRSCWSQNTPEKNGV